jgi:hypothetical protein
MSGSNVDTDFDNALSKIDQELLMRYSLASLFVIPYKVAHLPLVLTYDELIIHAAVS